jgi:hypothetical protein
MFGSVLVEGFSLREVISGVMSALAAGWALRVTLADAASTDHHSLIGKAKDCAAAAVPLTALGTVVVGVLIFGPQLLSLRRWSAQGPERLAPSPGPHSQAPAPGHPPADDREQRIAHFASFASSCAARARKM